MTLRALFFPLPLLLILCGGQANAQTIYKCLFDGKISYGETPCIAGAAQQVLTVPAAPLAPPDRNATLRQDAEQLTKQRHQREMREEQVQQRADKEAARKQSRCANLKLQRQWADEDAAHAMRDKHAGKAALKARRAGQKLAMECA